MSLLGLFLFVAANAAPIQVHYLGEVKLQSPDGASLGSKLTLIQRTIDREASQIRVEALEMAKEGAARQHKTTIEVTGNEIRLSNPEGTFEGTGAFTAGAPWEWTQWNYTVTFKNGSGTLKGWDKRTAEGITIRKEYFDGAGSPTLKMSYDLKLISPEFHAILKARLAP